MSLKLLIVDDNDSQRRKIRFLACEAGFTLADIAAVGNFDDAAEELDKQSFDLAVVDVVLKRSKDSEPSEEVGLSCMDAVRRSCSDCKIIALTTQLDTGVGSRAISKGAIDFVTSRAAFIDWQEHLTQRLKLWRSVVLLESATAASN